MWSPSSLPPGLEKGRSFFECVTSCGAKMRNIDRENLLEGSRTGLHQKM